MASRTSLKPSDESQDLPVPPQVVLVRVFESRPSLSEEKRLGVDDPAEYADRYSPWTKFYADRNKAFEQYVQEKAESVCDSNGRMSSVTVPNIGKLEVWLDDKIIGTLEYELCDPAPIQDRPIAEVPGVTINDGKMELDTAACATHIPESYEAEKELCVELRTGACLRVILQVHEPNWLEYDEGRQGVFYYYHVTAAFLEENDEFDDGTPPLPDA